MITQELYEFIEEPTGQKFLWDVTRAKAAIAGGAILMTVDMDAKTMQEISDNNDWTQDVVDAADPAVHGIGAPVIRDGEIHYILIDGTHRCVKAWQTNQKFEIDLLTDEAALVCQVMPPGPTMFTIRPS